MSATATAPVAPAERPAHRAGNVLRWLGAYTSSLVGDSVYYMALSGRPPSPAAPPRRAWCSRWARCRGRF